MSFAMLFAFSLHSAYSLNIKLIDNEFSSFIHYLFKNNLVSEDKEVTDIVNAMANGQYFNDNYIYGSLLKLGSIENVNSFIDSFSIDDNLKQKGKLKIKFYYDKFNNEHNNKLSKLDYKYVFSLNNYIVDNTTPIKLIVSSLCTLYGVKDFNIDEFLVYLLPSSSEQNNARWLGGNVILAEVTKDFSGGLFSIISEIQTAISENASGAVKDAQISVHDKAGHYSPLFRDIINEVILKVLLEKCFNGSLYNNFETFVNSYYINDFYNLIYYKVMTYVENNKHLDYSFFYNALNRLIARYPSFEDDLESKFLVSGVFFSSSFDYSKIADILNSKFKFIKRYKLLYDDLLFIESIKKNMTNYELNLMPLIFVLNKKDVATLNKIKAYHPFLKNLKGLNKLRKGFSVYKDSNGRSLWFFVVDDYKTLNNYVTSALSGGKPINTLNK